jgi:hypothetical protein
LKCNSGLEPSHARSRPLLFCERLCVEEHPLLRLFKNSLNQPSVEGMPRSLCDDMADEGHPEKREITNEIEYLMTNELIREPEARFIHNAVF